MTDPIIVQIRRGVVVESSHRVHAVVASADGVIDGWGETARLTMPRSAIKSIQVLPLLTAGAADAYDVTDDEIALASSSHGAEDVHLIAVAAWLDRIGLDPSFLECGPADPITPSAARALYREGGEATALHNCCSGKHAGFLTLSRHCRDQPGFGLPGYLAPEHSVQRLVREAQATFTGVDLSGQTPVIDGCGIPVFQFPLFTLATAMARLVTAESVPDDLAAAADRVVRALPSRALLVSGTGRAEQVLTDAATEPIILKGGAEGVFMGALPQRGIGLALKSEDGTNRGVEEALAAVLDRLQVTRGRVSIHSPLRNHAGTEVGDTAAILG